MDLEVSKLLQFSSVAQSCPTLCNPMNRSTLGPPVYHQLPEFTQTHVHRVADAIQPSLSLTPSSSLNLSQHQGLFQWSQIQGLFPWLFQGLRLFSSDDRNTEASASVFPVNIQSRSPLRLTGLISLLSKGLSGVFSSTTVQRHQFFGALPSLSSSSHKYVTTGKTIALTRQTFFSRVRSLFFNTMSRFLIAFLPRSNGLLISWLQSPSAVI